MDESIVISTDAVETVTSIPVSVPAMTVREKILILESEMKKCNQVEIVPVHYFARGLYAREIFVPKGVLLTGKIHRSEHLNIISKGDISVVTEYGTKRIKAPFTMVSQPGTKRVGYAHEDTVWTTIHATEETDVEKIELELIAPTYEDFIALQYEESKKQVTGG
jgi:hypothetical protein